MVSSPPPKTVEDDDDDFDDDDSAASYFRDADESATQSATEEKRDEVEQVKQLTGKQTRSVQVWRMLVVAVLLVTGAAVSTATYIFLTEAKEDDYKLSVSWKCRRSETAASMSLKF